MSTGKPLLLSPKDWASLTRPLRGSLAAPFDRLMSDIDTDLDRYAKAFSTMAKRNIAADVVRRTTAWEVEWKRLKPGDAVPQLVQRLREQAEGALKAAGGAARRKYDDVVCIGYVVSTGAWDPYLLARKRLNIVQYQSLAANDRGDMLMRCNTMITAIQEAYAAHELRNPPAPPVAGRLAAPDRTLKIFMAPEFYFRGVNGAYESDVVFDILPLLRQETDKLRYKDWLFVLGTAIMGTFVTETICPNCMQTLTPDLGANTANFAATRDAAHKTLALTCSACGVAGRQTYVGAMIDNVAFVQKGGEKGDKNTYVCTKEYVSGVDFRRVVPPPRRQGGRHGRIRLPDWWDMNARGRIKLFGRSTTALAPEGSRDPSSRVGPSAFADERMGGAIFEFDGIRFGLEICLDHLQNRLTGAENVEVQLVPSAGMEFNQFECVPGGIFFGVDGGCYLQAQVGANGPRLPLTSSATPVSVGGTVSVFDAIALP